jgi:ACR3 family arsenite efflux pump ArsB
MELIHPEVLKVFTNFFKLVFTFILFLLVFLLLYFGLRYILGGKKGAEEFHSRIVPLIIGIIVIFLSLTIPSLIRRFFE